MGAERVAHDSRVTVMLKVTVLLKLVSQSLEPPLQISSRSNETALKC